MGNLEFIRELHKILTCQGVYCKGEYFFSNAYMTLQAGDRKAL